MLKLWEKLLPTEYLTQVATPVKFEHHRDSMANAEKIIGFDEMGERCFVSHAFTLTEEGFDADEFPLLIKVYYERVSAWRLQYGMWVRSKSYCDRLDHCNPKLTTLPLEFMTSTWEDQSRFGSQRLG